MYLREPGSIITPSRSIIGSGVNAILFPNISFWTPFNDLGSGEVDLTLARGVGSATFTRATTATTVDSTGTIVSVASGTARSRYDPTSLEYQGYFAEGARTNICLQSEDLATTWVNTRSTDTSNATTAPDGTSTADKLVEDATAANTHHIAQVITYTNVIHTFSVWLKAGERTWARISMSDGTTAPACHFNLATGEVGTAANGSGTIKEYPDGWYRCTLTSTAAMAAAAGNCAVFCAEADNDVTYDGDGASGLYVWGAQVEAGSFASSYIPTTTASVTRNADSLTYQFAGNANATQGWCYAELSTIWTVTDATLNHGVISFGSAATSCPLLNENGGSVSTQIRSRCSSSSVTKNPLTDMATAVRKRAASWGGASKSVTGDGAAAATGTFGTFGSTAIGVGIEGDGAGSSWFGTIKNVRIGLNKVNDQQLQLMTR